MNIEKYTGYFHDGTVIDILHEESQIQFLLESSEISEEEPLDRSFLSTSNTLKGKLHILNVTRARIGNKEYEDVLKKQYDDGEILELWIHNNRMMMLVEWTNFPPKDRITNVSKIEIEAESIYWENIPSLAYPI